MGAASPGRILGLGLTLALFSACSHLQSANTVKDDQDSQSPKTVGEVLQQDLPKGVAEPSKITPKPGQEIVIRGIKLQNTQFDIPIQINSRVEFWVDYFQNKGRPFFERYLERSELFIPYIVPLLKQNGLPEDLVYLAMIESGFNNHARSRARAVGPWQFISATGKRYGLMVNWWVDERRDTRKSTLAAVEYLRDLYTMFQGWELAAAAYNAGEAKIARAIRRFGTTDFWELSRHRFLRPETRDYVPKIIAAALIAKNRTQFGFPASTVRPKEGEVVAGDGEVVRVVKESDAEQKGNSLIQKDAIANVLKQDPDADDDADDDEYEDAPANSQQAVMTPATLTATEAPGSEQAAPLARPVATPSVSKKGEISGEELSEFEVQSPADLLKVARAAGLSYQTVKGLNPDLLRWCTPPTVSTYRVKLPASVKEKFLAAYNQPAFERKVQFLAYNVRPGETLARIASHFGIKVDPISDLNGLSARMPLRHGMKVLLPMPSDRSRSLASLEIRDPPEYRRHRRRRRSRRSSAYRISYKRREAARGRKLISSSQGDSS